MKMKIQALSKISSLHYVKLIYRSLLFVAAFVAYIIGRSLRPDELFYGFEKDYGLLIIIWIIYAVEMALRFFPSKYESMGSQKQFAKNFRPTGKEKPAMQSWKRTFAVTVVWIALNGIIGVLYYLNIVDKGVLILISLLYGVCDMICILFFCPFQTWFMKNRCCAVCRIYNWDFVMMFTPFVFIPHWYTWSLLFLSLLLLLRWEISVHKNPERFSDRTNACLSCANCEERLCHHKKQLKGFWEKNKSRIRF